MGRVLIAGNGYAGYTAASILLDRSDHEVVLVSAEHYPHYCPHLLPDYGAGLITLDSLLLAEPEDYSRPGLTFLPGRQLEKVDEKENIACLSDGTSIKFDYLIAATGSQVYIPEALSRSINLNCANVLSVKHITDAERMLGLVSQGARRFTIIGAGRIGVLTAEALVKKGLEVTMVDIAPHSLAAMVIPEIGRLVDDHLRQMGINLLTSTTVESSEDDGYSVFSIKMADGTVIPSHVVIVATGVKPSVSYLAGRIDSADGLPVNQHMQTADPSIYAAGDVVQYHTLTGRRKVVPLVINAVRQARTAALNIAGQKTSAPPSFEGNIVRLNDRAVISIGEKQGSDIDLIETKEFSLALIREGTEVVGVEFFGPPESAGSLASLVSRKFAPGSISTLKYQLLHFFPYLLAGGTR